MLSKKAYQQILWENLPTMASKDTLESMYLGEDFMDWQQQLHIAQNLVSENSAGQLKLKTVLLRGKEDLKNAELIAAV